MTAPHALVADEVARRLGTDSELGLAEAEAEARLDEVGPNRLERAARPAYARIALRQFADPLVGLLIVAAVVSAVIGEGVEAAVIGAIVVLNALLGFVQEAGAERAVLALREVLEVRASVVRSGREREVPAEELVPGDLVVVREGGRVPADGRLAATAGLAVDESELTGESVPVDKAVDPVPEETPLADRSSMVYAGTAVTRGRASFLVTATGQASEVGRIAELTGRARRPTTPLQRRVGALTRVMVAIGILVTLGLGAAMLARGSSLHEAFLVGVSVAVAAVPEGLAATVTIALALGARTMAERGAIARRLTAVETLGSTTVIASDKTGTLTENRLRLAAAEPAPGRDESELLAAAALASTARLLEEGPEPRVVGDPVDAALVLAAHDEGLTRSRLLERRSLVHERPFDPARKRMTLVYAEPEGRRAYVKGAPETILAGAGGAGREELEQLAESWAAEGLRVLAVAERPLSDSEAHGAELDRDLRLVGLVALHDPLRPAARQAVAEARAAGVRVAMVTGDHPATARAVGRELGLDERNVHARVAPAEKLELVERLQAGGRGGGGDGRRGQRRARASPGGRRRRDGPRGHGGRARGGGPRADRRRLRDDRRRHTRREGDHRQHPQVRRLPPLGEPRRGGALRCCDHGGVRRPDDGRPGAAHQRAHRRTAGGRTGARPRLPATMRRPPERGSRLFPPRAWAALCGIGALVGLTAWAAFLIGDGGEEARTMAFATIALAELGLVFSVRSPIRPAWQEPRNPYLVGSVVLSAAVVAACLYGSALNDLFGTVPLGGPELAVVCALALVPFAAVEAAKAVFRRVGWTLGPAA